MERPPRGDNPDQAFLDNIIALALDIQELSQQIIDLSDDPAVLRRTVEIKKAGERIQDKTRTYRPRLVTLERTAKRKSGVYERVSQ